MESDDIGKEVDEGNREEGEREANVRQLCRELGKSMKVNGK